MHDVVEDTDTDVDDLAGEFGAAIASLVDGVSKLDQIQFNTRAEAQAESRRDPEARREGWWRRTRGGEAGSGEPGYGKPTGDGAG